MITRSVEENIRIAFDRFYENLKFNGIILDNTELQELMVELEDNVVTEALSEYTSEVEEIKEESYDDGYENGREIGFDDGYEVGYQTAKEELECTQ